MCIICIDYQNQLITIDEARRNMCEMVIEPEHALEIKMMLCGDDDYDGISLTD